MGQVPNSRLDPISWRLVEMKNSPEEKRRRTCLSLIPRMVQDGYLPILNMTDEFYYGYESLELQKLESLVAQAQAARIDKSEKTRHY